MKDRIIHLIHDINPFDEIDSNTKLIEEGIIDSLTLVLLMEQMEEEFNVSFPEDDLKPENFATVAEIESLINRLKGKKS